MRRAEAVGQRAGLGEVAAGDRRHDAVLGILDGRNNCSRAILAVDRIPQRNIFVTPVLVRGGESVS